MPMAIGFGAGSLVDKIKAMVLKFSRETHDINALRQAASQVQSFTVDLGVEAGLSEANATDFLPAWTVSANSLQPDEGDLGG